MQTFLPYPDLRQSVEALDWRRLGKQRSEALTLLRVLYGCRKGYQHYPATLMWKGYEDTLAIYYNLCVQEWIKRGYNNNLFRVYFPRDHTIIYPPWWGGPIHSDHRRALLYKAELSQQEFQDGKKVTNADLAEWHWYHQFGWTELINYDAVKAGKKYQYYWPVRI